ncbi:molybdate ABC transporter permease subunit [Bacillus sp. 2205SS5-2]|uniref:molybdate ABC transporter permease subunit n=1 Tax=Bacillus sp. 2205SS5-2 TaxID=3109031 RepID=UPI0030054C2B
MTQSFWFPIQFSIIVATTATIITFSVAVLIAYRLKSSEIRGKSVLEAFFLLPLVLPPSVLGFLLLIMFGMNSPIGIWIQSLFNQTLLFTKGAAIIAATIVAFPLMYQAAKTGLSGVNSDIEAAARVDGAGEWKVFYYVSLPLAIKSLLMGVILSFTRALGEFGATLMFAGNIPGKTQTISTAIYVAIESGENILAWQYVSVSIGLSFFLLLLIKLIEKDK